MCRKIKFTAHFKALVLFSDSKIALLLQVLAMNTINWNNRDKLKTFKNQIFTII